MSCECVATGLINFLPLRNCFFFFFSWDKVISKMNSHYPLKKIVFALVPHCFVMILKRELRYL